jgi:phage tail tape-measure protein
MALPEIQPVQKKTITKTKRGGGGLGEIIGTVAGGVAGSFAGPGGTLAGISGGAALGGRVGSMLGEKVQPTRQTQTQAPVAQQQLQAPRLSANGQQLQQSLLALKEFAPEFQEQISFPLVAALMKDVQQNNPGMGVQQPQQQPQGLGGFQQQQPGLNNLA